MESKYMDNKMFCFQCEQTAGCSGCTGNAGVCGKDASTAKLQDELTGALIGLVKTCGSSTKTENTDRIIIEGLFTTITNVNFNNQTLQDMIDKVHNEKNIISPGCSACEARCGNTDDYDMERLWNGPDQVRSLKIRLFSGLKKTGRDAFKVIENGKGKDKHFQSIMESSYKGRFILAEDWEPEEILPAIAELDEAEIMVKEFL